MTPTQQVLVGIKEERRIRNAEEARWARHRVEAGVPAWISALLCMVGLVGMLFLAGYLSSHPEAIMSPLGPLLPLAAGLVVFASWLAKRRQRTLIRIIQEEAPALYKKLEDERIVRYIDPTVLRMSRVKPESH